MNRITQRQIGVAGLAIALLFSVWPTVAVAQRPASPTGTFSSMYYHPEGTDLLGTEIRIVYTRKGFQGTIQSAEGEPDELILIKPKIDDNNNFTFELSDPLTGEHYTISGRITEAGLETKGWSGENILKRAPSYWDERRTSPP